MVANYGKVLEALRDTIVSTFPSPRPALPSENDLYKRQWFNPDNAGSATHMGMRNLGHYAVGLQCGTDATTIELFRERQGGELALFYTLMLFPGGLNYSHMAGNVSPQELTVLAWCLRTLAVLQREAERGVTALR